MPTTIITGRDITFTIASTQYSSQATSATLSNAPTISTYQTLAGQAYKHIADQWTFTVDLLSDWEAGTGGLCEAMWTAANSAPNTALAVSLTAVTGAVFTFTVLPVFPNAGGAAPDAQTDTWAMLVTNTPTGTFAP